MPQHYREFQRLMEEVRAGCDGAMRELIDIYGRHIYRVVRHLLKRQHNRPLRIQFDSQDFYQSVWASFLSNRDNVARFQKPQELVAFLAAMTSNKIIDQLRRLIRKRDGQ